MNTVEYKIRKLNLLDIRRMAKILREVKIPKEEFKNIVYDIFSSAKTLSGGTESGENVGGFIKAIVPAFEGLLSLFADSDSFWEFLASLLSVPYAELENIGVTEIKDIVTAVIGDEQVAAFFTSITKTEVMAMTAG